MYILDKDRDAVDDKETDHDQDIGEGQLVVEGEVGVGVGGRSAVGLVQPRVIVAVEQHRILHEVPL